MVASLQAFDVWEGGTITMLTGVEIYSFDVWEGGTQSLC